MLDDEQREQAEMKAWAKARERFLMEAFPEVYSQMQKAGTLGAHLTDVGEEAFLLFNQTQGDIRARLMKDATMPLLQRANEIEQAQVVASEIVMSDVILVPPPRLDEANCLAGAGQRLDQMSLEDLKSRISSLEEELPSIVKSKPGSALWFEEVEEKVTTKDLIESSQEELAKRQGR